MGYFRFDDSTREIIFFRLDSSGTERPGEKQTLERYPVGKSLIAFLDADLGDYEKARRQLIGQIQTGAVTPAKALEDAADLVKNGTGPGLRRHPYFAGLRLREEEDSAEAALDRLQDHDYAGGQRALAKALLVCLDLDEPAKLVSFSSEERFMIGWTLDEFQLPVKYDSIRSGFSFSDPRRPFAIYDDLFLDRNQGLMIGHKTVAGLPPDVLEKFRKTFAEKPNRIREGFSDSDPLAIATLELMKMVQLGVRVRKCAHCGRYFIVKGDYGTRYCDRVQKGGTRTCQGVGALKKYKQKVQASELLKAYTKAYNRKYNQMRIQGRISPDEFKTWAAGAKVVRDRARDGYITEAAAIEWLNGE